MMFHRKLDLLGQSGEGPSNSAVASLQYQQCSGCSFVDLEIDGSG